MADQNRIPCKRPAEAIEGDLQTVAPSKILRLYVKPQQTKPTKSHDHDSDSQTVDFLVILKHFESKSDVEDETTLQCPVCEDLPEDPRLASCAHLYCEECYTELVSRSGLELGSTDQRLLCRVAGCGGNIANALPLDHGQWEAICRTQETHSETEETVLQRKDFVLEHHNNTSDEEDNSERDHSPDDEDVLELTTTSDDQENSELETVSSEESLLEGYDSSDDGWDDESNRSAGYETDSQAGADMEGNAMIDMEGGDVTDYSDAYYSDTYYSDVEVKKTVTAKELEDLLGTNPAA